MDVRIGDIVRFISEKLEGKVTGIVDNNTVNVYCDEYGFEIPASVNDLVVIYSDSKKIPEGGTQQLEMQKAVDMESTDRVYVAFVPENYQNLTDSRYDVYVVNDTCQTCLYSATSFDGQKYVGMAAGNCNQDAVCLLGNYSIKELDNLKVLHVQVIFYQKGNRKWKSAIDAKIKISPVSLCKGGVYKHVRWFNQVAMLRALDKEGLWKEEEVKVDAKQLLQAEREKVREDVGQERMQKRPIGNSIIEVDLHIQQLLDNTAGMENKDMLDYQLEVFRKTLDEYKLRRGQKIVFIHGKGDGVLRQRILWELQTKYKRFHHQDASFKQYGYGATMVTIR